jgi:inorganic phosphate transporter, PiT family
MGTALYLALVTMGLAYAFDFVNGFHDTANAVTTIIYTKAMNTWAAIIMSGVLNFLGAVIVGTAVAMIITKVIPEDKVTTELILAALIGGLIWNVGTWYKGLPVSSSHTLVGGLFGAGLAANWLSGVHWAALTQIVLALLVSPVLGMGLSLAITRVSRLLSDRFVTTKEYYLSDTYVNGGKPPRSFRWMTILSGAAVSFSHGSNDGQKTMGVITLILIAEFGHSQTAGVPLWVVITASIAIGLGTMIGGRRIIRTVGEKIGHAAFTHVQGFGAQFAAAVIILLGSRFGAPVSTTHVLSSAVVGATISEHTHKGVNTKTVSSILLAWLVTLPAAALLAALAYFVIDLI